MRKSGDEAEAESARARARARQAGRRQSAEKSGRAEARPATHMPDEGPSSEAVRDRAADGDGMPTMRQLACRTRDDEAVARKSE